MLKSRLCEFGFQRIRINGARYFSQVPSLNVGNVTVYICSMCYSMGFIIEMVLYNLIFIDSTGFITQLACQIQQAQFGKLILPHF